jgi:hypothetical protein
MIVNNQVRRDIMKLAWGLYRSDQGPGRGNRSFADALAGAWRFHKRNAAAKPSRWARGRKPRFVHLTGSAYSPADRALQGQPWARPASWQKGGEVARLGR